MGPGAALIAAFGLLGAAEASAADGAETALRSRLRPHYTTLAARAGIELLPNTPLWERSLDATVRATVTAMDQAVAMNRVPRSFTMPTFGMEPTILKGELFYALEDYYRTAVPQRGDIVLYKIPRKGLSYVRRVVALPGETVQLVEGVPHVNGTPAARERLGIFVDSGSKRPLARFRESIQGGPAYEIVADADRPRLGTIEKTVLGDGIYFVLGDNREEIADTAIPELSLVPRDNIVDRPQIVWLSKDLSRIGKTLQSP